MAASCSSVVVEEELGEGETYEGCLRAEPDLCAEPESLVIVIPRLFWSVKPACTSPSNRPNATPLLWPPIHETPAKGASRRINPSGVSSSSLRMLASSNRPSIPHRATPGKARQTHEMDVNETYTVSLFWSDGRPVVGASDETDVIDGEVISAVRSHPTAAPGNGGAGVRPGPLYVSGTTGS